jgi:hypothetical protein
MIYLLFAFYLLGGVGVLLNHAYKSAKSPLTPWDSVPDYCKLHAPHILMNFGVSTAIFLGVWRDTTFLTKMLLLVGVHKDIQIPLNPLTAILFGIAGDPIADVIISALGYAVAKAKLLLPGTAQGDANDQSKP